MSRDDVVWSKSKVISIPIGDDFRVFNGERYYLDVMGYPFWDKVHANRRVKFLRALGIGARVTECPKDHHMGKYMVWIHKPGRK